MVKPRNRLVNFRVTDEEYEALRAASQVQGARSLSDFARVVILEAAQRPSDHKSNVVQREDALVHTRLLSLDERLTVLECDFSRLRPMLREVRVPRAPRVLRRA